MKNNNFKFRVQTKLEREGYKVIQVKDSMCGFELISINPNGKVAGVRTKAHGHITVLEKKKLLSYNIPIYIASEAYSMEGGHKIKVVRLK